MIRQFAHQHTFTLSTADYLVTIALSKFETYALETSLETLIRRAKFREFNEMRLNFSYL